MDFNGFLPSVQKFSFVSMSSDGYFAYSSLRAGLFGGTAMQNLTLPNSDREAIGREIMKELIREEVLARDMVERRILEEEVRNEIEMELIMEIRRLQMERLSGLADNCVMVMQGDRQTKTDMPSWLEAEIATSLGRGIAQDAAEFAFRERSSPHHLHKNPMAVMTQSALQHESEKHPPANETITSNSKLSGAKRKKSAEKLWGCALCEVIASSEEALKEHVQGKEHEERKSLLSFNKQDDIVKFKQNAAPPLAGASDGGGHTNKKPLEGKKQQKFYCILCRVKCNGLLILECHLAGKKHRKFLELKKHKINLKTEEVKKAENCECNI